MGETMNMSSAFEDLMVVRTIATEPRKVEVNESTETDVTEPTTADVTESTAAGVTAPVPAQDSATVAAEQARNLANVDIAQLRETEREHRDRMRSHLHEVLAKVEATALDD